MASEILSVRLSPHARKILNDEAATHDAAGASALSRDILERWATETHEAKVKASAERAAAFLLEHPDWGDNPADFFPSIND